MFVHILCRFRVFNTIPISDVNHHAHHEGVVDLGVVKEKRKARAKSISKNQKLQSCVELMAPASIKY